MLPTVFDLWLALDSKDVDCSGAFVGSSRRADRVPRRLHYHDLETGSGPDCVENFDNTLGPNCSDAVASKGCVDSSGTAETLAESLRCRMNMLLHHFSDRLNVVSRGHF